MGFFTDFIVLLIASALYVLIVKTFDSAPAFFFASLLIVLTAIVLLVVEAYEEGRL